MGRKLSKSRHCQKSRKIINNIINGPIFVTHWYARKNLNSVFFFGAHNLSWHKEMLCACMSCCPKTHSICIYFAHISSKILLQNVDVIYLIMMKCWSNIRYALISCDVKSMFFAIFMIPYLFNGTNVCPQIAIKIVSIFYRDSLREFAFDSSALILCRAAHTFVEYLRIFSSIISKLTCGC